MNVVRVKLQPQNGGKWMKNSQPHVLFLQIIKQVAQVWPLIFYFPIKLYATFFVVKTTKFISHAYKNPIK